MKIAYLIHRFPWPSETFVSREILQLLEMGMDIGIFAFEGPPESDIKLLSEAVKELAKRTHYVSKFEAAKALASLHWQSGISLNRRLSREASVRTQPLLRIARACSIARQVRLQGFDAIHAHWPYGTQIAQLVHEMTDVPFSASVHAHEVAHDNGHFNSAFESITFASFCNAAAMQHLLKQLPPAARKKAHLIYHGVDTQAFAYSAAMPDSGPLRVLSAGRITPTKGFDRLVRSCAKASSAGLNLTLTILGRGPSSEGLKQIAAELGFSDRLHLPGWVSHNAVRSYINGSHVFALMANDDFNDGLPNVVLEAMACGRPAILSPMPAAPEAVEHGVSGFILKSTDDEAGLISVLRQLAINPDVARTMGAAARDRIVERYDSRRHIQQLKTLLERAHQ